MYSFWVLVFLLVRCIKVVVGQVNLPLTTSKHQQQMMHVCVGTNRDSRPKEIHIVSISYDKCGKTKLGGSLSTRPVPM